MYLVWTLGHVAIKIDEKQIKQPKKLQKLETYI